MHQNNPNLNSNIYFEPLVLLGGGPNRPIWFFEEFKGFFSTKFAHFFANGLYQPPEQLLGGGKCRF